MVYQLVIKRELIKSQQGGSGGERSDDSVESAKVRKCESVKCESVKKYESVNKLNAPTK